MLTRTVCCLAAVAYAMTVCGEGQQRSPVNENEQASLRSLRRGATPRGIFRGRADKHWLPPTIKSVYGK